VSDPGATEPPVAEDVLPLDEVGLHPVADGAAGEAYAGDGAASSEPDEDEYAYDDEDDEDEEEDGSDGDEDEENDEDEEEEYDDDDEEDEDESDGEEGEEGYEEDEEYDEEAEAGDASPFEAPEAMCRMLFVDVVLVLPSTNPVVVLQEADPPYRELRIPIGGPEGVAIGYAARQMQTPRPLTHELMSRLLEAFSLSLDVVRITESTGRTFRAEIVVSGPSGSRTIDCRPSDAIALSLRQRVPVPIVAAPAVLEAAGGEAAGSN